MTSFDPHRTAAGVRPRSLADAVERQATAPVRRIGEDDPRRGVADLLGLLPSVSAFQAWFAQISVPVGLTASAGDSAWFTFGSIRIPQDMPPSALVGLDVELLPTDNAGAGDGVAASPLAWGDARGRAAALVVSRDLPGPFQTWSFRPANLPMVETTGLLGQRSSARYFYVSRFPTGKLNDTAANKMRAAERWAPHVYRLPSGSRLDFALAVRASAVTGGVGVRQLCGDVLVTAYLATTHHASNL